MNIHIRAKRMVYTTMPQRRAPVTTTLGTELAGTVALGVVAVIPDGRVPVAGVVGKVPEIEVELEVHTNHSRNRRQCQDF